MRLTDDQRRALDDLEAASGAGRPVQVGLVRALYRHARKGQVGPEDEADRRRTEALADKHLRRS